MTNQEAFDKVWDWFLVQGNPLAYIDVGGPASKCVFWGDGGKLRCAVGCLVTPEQAYDLEENRTCLSELHDNDSRAWDLLGLPDDVGFLEVLQSSHDAATDAEGSQTAALQENLATVALRFNLKVPGEG